MATAFLLVCVLAGLLVPKTRPSSYPADDPETDHEAPRLDSGLPAEADLASSASDA